jgi:hypothetical protein
MQAREGPRQGWLTQRVRFGMRASMAGVFVAACTLGWIVHRAQVQRDAVDAVRRAGGVVYYDWRVVV